MEVQDARGCHLGTLKGVRGTKGCQRISGMPGEVQDTRGIVGGIITNFLFASSLFS